MNSKTKASKSSDENYTPNTKDQPIISLVCEVMGEIELDPCSNSKKDPNVPAKKHYTIDDDSLAKNWEGKVFLNPPYSNPLPFLLRLSIGFTVEHIPEAIALLKSGTQHNKGTGELIKKHASAICQWGAGEARRIGFINQDGEQKMGADFDCILVYFGHDWKKFYHIFNPYGHVVLCDRIIKKELGI